MCGSSWSHFNRDALDDLQAAGLERFNFFGIVRQEVNPKNSQVFEDGGTRLIVALIGVEAQVAVCFDRISALVLKLISDELVEQTDAASFLWVVDNDAGTGLVDGPHGKLQLISTVAAGRREYVSRQTLRMNPYQRGLGLRQITLNQHNIRTLLAMSNGFITQNPKFPIFCGKG